MVCAECKVTELSAYEQAVEQSVNKTILEERGQKP